VGNKEKLWIRMMKRFYGISGVLDEYRRSQVEHIGNNAFMVMFWYMLLSNLLATIFAYKYPEATLWVFIGCNLFFIIYVICGYIMIATSHLKLTENEVEPKDLVREKRKIIFKGIGLGVYFAVTMHLLEGLIDVVIGDGNFFESILSPNGIIGSFLGGLFFGGMMYLVMIVRLKKIDE
jgi:hypothetical protein